MSNRITLLPDHVASQIAAGEVIQRPASVVKELLENAVDAGSDTIQLIIKDAGKTLVQVIDNGMGMNSTDIRLAFERHATSKINVAEDLFALNTKGFRGEALASIAAIAHVETHTRVESEEVSHCLKIEGSKVIEQTLSTQPKGTSIAVKSLFYNIPARRNFLKSDTVELRHIIDEFHRVALAHPELKFLFFNNGTELFDLPGTNLRKRIVGIFGSKLDALLVPVEETTTLAKLTGFVLKPTHAKKTRGQQFFFVNDRFIRSPFLHHAVSNAFEGLLRPGFKPGYFLYLELNPKTIASAITTGNPLGGQEIIDKAYQYDWLYASVSEDEILKGQTLFAKEGFYVEPATATLINAIKQLSLAGKIKAKDKVVMILTGGGLKDPIVNEAADAAVINVDDDSLEKSLLNFTNIQ